MTKTYSQLLDSTKERFSSMLKLLHKSGLTTSEVRNFTPRELKNALGNKAVLKTNKAYLSVIRQMTKNFEVKENTVNLALNTYKQFGFRTKGLKFIEKQLSKAMSNTFNDIAKRLQKINPKLTKKQSYIKARDLLKVPKSDYVMLNQQERLVLADYDY